MDVLAGRLGKAVPTTAEIRIEGIRGRGRHGVLAGERREQQGFVVDVALGVDVAAAAATDALSDTVDYGAVATAIHEIIEGEPVNLLETLAQRIAERCLADPRVASARVTVHKPAAPMPVPFDDVMVTVHRESGDRT